MTSDPREQRAREVAERILDGVALIVGFDGASVVSQGVAAQAVSKTYKQRAELLDEITRALLAERRAGMEQCEAIAVDYLDRMLRSAAKLHPITGQYPNGIAECKADAAQTILDRIRALAAGKEGT